MPEEREMKKMKMILAAVLLLILAVPSYADEAGVDDDTIATQVYDINQFGNIILNLHATAVLDHGIDIGDIVLVTLNGTEYDMPVVTNYSDVDQGAFLCRLVIDDDKDPDVVVLGINMGDLATWSGIAAREKTDEAPGYKWTMAEGVPDPVPVTLTLKEKGGYDEQLSLHQLVRSDNREDYPDLDDAAFANFREITTTGMGSHALYRSSSPINPQLGRNKEADAACEESGIKTFINMADSDAVMRGYEGFEDTYYSTGQIIALAMVVDFQSEEFRDSLAEGFTFITEHDGPYLVHCTEGKDRAGFASAVLEALMGADADEIVQDYMLSYYNYYGIEPGSDMYTKIADANIRKSLAAAFGLDSLEGEDLSAHAEAYLRGTGLSDKTILDLREKLGSDY